jgi:hypothetical protein
MCGPTVMVGFSSCRLMISKDTPEGVGYRNFMMDLLKGSFFNNYVKGIGILILLSSCSRLKEVGVISDYFISGTAGFDKGSC